MTRQTSAPLEHLSLNTADRQAREIVRSFSESFGLDLNPPYQRGQVWTEDQQIALVRSWLTGTPTGVVIFNDRSTPEWKAANGYDPSERDEPIYACIDGQQRISAARAWFGDELAVPASWFEPQHVTQTVDTHDGPYVRWGGLSLVRQRQFANRAHLAIATARVATVQEEAAIYVLVNGGGTPQSDADMENAARIAEDSS
ncbi:MULTISPECIES: DUF262 domain-containing protein [unclassified Streptomyces]|uniref:DUF262 domain-containing protein n=1 Tax=unclassified Streptomyces TaxID=2593676 RepID=UPI00278BC225|nr:MULTISPECIES: DUF262 domain-containing protein [unclassified Streptomyces]